MHIFTLPQIAGAPADLRSSVSCFTCSDIHTVICGVSTGLPLSLFGQGCRAVACCRAALCHPPSRVPRATYLPLVFLNTTTRLATRDAQRLTVGTWVFGRGAGRSCTVSELFEPCLNPRCWSRLRSSKRVASGPRFTRFTAEARAHQVGVTGPGRPGTCRCAPLLGWTASRRETYTCAPYRCTLPVPLRTGHVSHRSQDTGGPYGSLL